MPPSPPRRRNGWRDGTDPAQRWLRIGTVVVTLGVFTVVALDVERRDIGTLALALAASLILLGYEGVVRLPGIMRGDKDEEERR